LRCLPFAQLEHIELADAGGDQNVLREVILVRNERVAQAREIGV